MLTVDSSPMGPLHGISDTAIAADAGTHHTVAQAAQTRD